MPRCCLIGVHAQVSTCSWECSFANIENTHCYCMNSAGECGDCSDVQVSSPVQLLQRTTAVEPPASPQASRLPVSQTLRQRLGRPPMITSSPVPTCSRRPLRTTYTASWWQPPRSVCMQHADGSSAVNVQRHCGCTFSLPSTDGSSALWLYLFSYSRWLSLSSDART